MVVLVQRSIVAHLQRINVLVRVVVEQNGGAGLALEVDAVLLLTGHLEDLYLQLGELIDGGWSLAFRVFDLLLVDRLFNVKVELPSRS